MHRRSRQRILASFAVSVLALRANDPAHANPHQPVAVRCAQGQCQPQLTRRITPRPNVAQMAPKTPTTPDRSKELVVTHAMSLIDQGRGADDLELRLVLEEPPFSFRSMREVREHSVGHAAVVEARRAQLRKSQSQLDALVEKLGGQVQAHGFLTNYVEVLLPAEAVAPLFALYPIVSVELHGEDDDDETDWGGPRRELLGLTHDAWRGRGVTGDRGGGWSAHLPQMRSEVLVGIMEPDDGINRVHRSFLDWPDGPSNILESYRCRWIWFLGRRCRSKRAIVTDRPTHGTRVASVLMGSLEEGQDPDLIPDAWTIASGIATEAKVLYYQGDGAWNLVSGIEHAVRRGVDVINMSRSRRGDYCRDGFLGGANPAIARATDGGALVIVSAGNDGARRSGKCSVNSYATIPDAMAIGALEAAYSLEEREDMLLASYSGRGGPITTLAGGRRVQQVLVDLVAMGSSRSVAGTGVRGYDDSISVGTSFSAPQVAGAAALLRDWGAGRGGISGLEADPYAIRTLLSVMGDGKRNDARNVDPNTHLDLDTGFGALRIVDLDRDLGDGTWGLARHELWPRETLEWPVGSGEAQPQDVLGWKFAAVVDTNELQGAPDLHFDLVDRCPLSGKHEEILQSADIEGLKARMLVGPAQRDKIAQRCLWVRVHVAHASRPVRLYTADYSFTQAPLRHLTAQY